MSCANSITKNQRLRSSNFYITINSNKHVVLVDQLTLEEDTYFQQFDAAWKRYFDQSPDVWLKFLMPGDNTKNSFKSIDFLAHAELQLSRRSMIHAHMLIEIKHYTKVHLDFDKLRAYMESAMGHHIHVDNKIPGIGKEDLDQPHKGIYTERRDIIKCLH